ncbi:RagB/SusD family nutrient uptake outer membrane protein [Niastella populi]|uniref:RagB/SusD family protein n=1 Tax=Niastella populi TaxID=550983 RepID=A0A1V9F0M2_9BACT|nr:RagB/SusD family nutrient uptake outer membrane protein [Niastella populi]OQP51890.1 RagB/SusD family protein [Niastella populi]
MKLSTIKYITCFVMAGALLMATGCKKDYTDPSRAIQERVIRSAAGLTGVAVGVQRAYALGRGSSLYNLVTTDGFLTKQLTILNQGNTAEYQLFLGGDQVNPTNNSIVLSFWTNSNKVIYDANNVLKYAPELADKNYASGLIAYVSIFKALALTNMAMFWEQVPDTTGTNVGFITNSEALNKALGVVNNALATVNANAISAAFLSNIPAGIDIVNTLHALRARLSLYTGNYAQALAAANAVDLSKRSTLNFDLQSLNPIFETATSTNNVFQPLDSTMGLPPALEPNLADKRVPFYIAIGANPRYRIGGFGATSTIGWPLYLPGEITLIKAEAYARMTPPDLVNGLIELNKVITKQPADDPFGVGAGLPPSGPLTQPELLEQIYRHRAIELFMSGLRLMDSRRFNRPVSERKRNYLPYPNQERNNNTNTPTDPAF